MPAGFTGACDAQPQYAMFIKEVELERLNLARTAEAVIANKLADVTMKLRFADEIALESTGRIAYDESRHRRLPRERGDVPVADEDRDHPGAPDHDGGTAGRGRPDPADAPSNSQFDAWELAAMNIGAAASKSTPLTLDAVEYYNRIIGFPPTADYTVDRGRAARPSSGPPTRTTGRRDLARREQFVDYSGFTYNRSETFKGSVTWLDVTTLTWKVSKITDQVPFTNLSSYAEIGTNTLTGITAFAQLADDVRAHVQLRPGQHLPPRLLHGRPGSRHHRGPAQGDPRPGSRPRHAAGERLPDLPLRDDGVAAQPLGRRRSSTRRSCA